jgi:hypothetical protein
MDQPSCDRCGRRLGGVVAWVTHRGGPLCAMCVDDNVYAELERLWALEWRAPRCEGGCGRVVLDLRHRGQSALACSSVWRRVYYNEIRRMERRAQRSVAPIKCLECDADLRVSRSDVRYCSTRCRVRAHRRRRREGSTSARRLRTGGSSSGEVGGSSRRTGRPSGPPRRGTRKQV